MVPARPTTSLANFGSHGSSINYDLRGILEASQIYCCRGKRYPALAIEAAIKAKTKQVPDLRCKQVGNRLLLKEIIICWNLFTPNLVIDCPYPSQSCLGLVTS
ncbi:hypothetical protein LguiB_005683 [Lonicera macranthoides]